MSTIRAFQNNIRIATGRVTKDGRFFQAYPAKMYFNSEQQWRDAVSKVFAVTFMSDKSVEKVAKKPVEKPVEKVAEKPVENKNIVQTRSIQTRSMTRAAYKKQLENSGPPKFDWAKIWAKIDADAEAKMAQKAKDDAHTSLWNSGCENLCYHFGFCSDIMEDCWEPVYDESGLKGLKKDLRSTSNRIHDGKVCEDCKKWINGLHD